MGQAQARVIGLVGALTAEQAQVRVPACPDWTVRDLLSHMVGLGADVVAGDEPDDHNAAWTANQVATRRDHDVAALVTEWEGWPGRLREWMREHGTRPLSRRDHPRAGPARRARRARRPGLGGGARRPGPVRGPASAARVGDLPPMALVGDCWRWDVRAAAPTTPRSSSARRSSSWPARCVTRRSAHQLRSAGRPAATSARTSTAFAAPRPAARPGPVRVRRGLAPRPFS